jgi:hypothetical protein
MGTLVWRGGGRGGGGGGAGGGPCDRAWFMWPTVEDRRRRRGLGGVLVLLTSYHCPVVRVCALMRFIYIILVGCPCVATAYNNTYVNYSLKKFQDFLLIVSALHIIFFFNLVN